MCSLPASLRIFRYPLARHIIFVLLVASALIAPLSLSQDHSGQVMVRVRETGIEVPLAQASVQLLRFPDGLIAEQFTGSDGSVQFSGIAVGGYTIRATLAGFRTGEAHIDFRRGDSTLQTVDLNLARMENEKTPSSPQRTVSSQALQIPGAARKEFERGQRLLAEKKARESVPAFQRAISLYSGYGDAYFLLGTAQLQINEASAAEVSLRKAIALDEHRSAPYYPLAMLLYSQRRLDEEHELLLKARGLDPADWRWPFELARCEAAQERWESALTYARAAGKSSSAPTRVHLLLADIYSNANRPRDAVSELELFATLDPQSPYMDRVREVLPTLRQRAAADSQP